MFPKVKKSVFLCSLVLNILFVYLLPPNAAFDDDKSGGGVSAPPPPHTHTHTRARAGALKNFFDPPHAPVLFEYMYYIFLSYRFTGIGPPD